MDWPDNNSTAPMSEEERAHRLAVIRAKIQEAIDDPIRITDKELSAHFDRLTEEALKKRRQ